jgi:hypothetical protein
MMWASRALGVGALVYDWSGNFGTGPFSSESGKVAAADASGNVILSGDFVGAVDFGGGLLTSTMGSTDIFVAKLDPTANHVWSKRFGDAAEQYGGVHGAAVDASGNVVVTGYFHGSMDFGGGPLTAVGQRDDIYVATLDPSGNHLWSKKFGDSPEMAGDVDQLGESVAIDASGNVLVTGFFQGWVNFGGATLKAAAFSWDMFVVKFDASGNHVWSKDFGAAGTAARAYCVVADPWGNVVVTGNAQGPVDFGGGPLPWTGSEDIVLAKLDSNGNHVWSRSFGDAAAQYATSVATDASGSVILAGYFEDTVNFGGGPLTSAGAYDMFIAKFDAAGNHVWSKRFGASNHQTADAVAVDGFGSVIVTGLLRGTVDFGGGPLTALISDVFVAKFDAAGNHIWSQRYGEASAPESGFQTGLGAAVDASDNVVVTGRFTVSLDFGPDTLTTAGPSDQNIFVVRFTPDYVTGVAGNDIPRANYLRQNVPNPFNPRTTITYGLHAAGHASLRIYDASGRLVRVLVEGYQGPGPHDVEWNGEDELHRGVASGVYFCRLDAAGETLTRKLVLLR